MKRTMMAISIITGLLLAYSTAFARSTDIVSGGGLALWIFLIVGGIVVLLQLIPALILFIGFIVALFFKKEVKENEKINN
jgi:hypothetical protein